MKVESFEHPFNTMYVNHNVVNKVNGVPILNVPVGVSVSGGADSSILLYTLMKYSREKIYIFTTGNRQKGFKNIEASMNVVAKCIELTGNINVEHHISYTEEQSFETTFPKLIRYLETNQVRLIHTAITSNPPQEVCETFTHMPSQINRDPKSKKNKWFLGNRVHCPFYDIDKQGIRQIYEKEGVLDTLFPATRSCETKEDIGLGHCGECWWCQERNWAFGQL